MSLSLTRIPGLKKRDAWTLLRSSTSLTRWPEWSRIRGETTFLCTHSVVGCSEGLPWMKWWPKWSKKCSVRWKVDRRGEMIIFLKMLILVKGKLHTSLGSLNHRDNLVIYPSHLRPILANITAFSLSSHHSSKTKGSLRNKRLNIAPLTLTSTRPADRRKMTLREWPKQSQKKLS